MENDNIKEKVLNEIHKINKKSPAQQKDLKSSLNLDQETLINILNTLNDEGKISAINTRKNNSLTGPKILDFAHITINN